MSLDNAPLLRKKQTFAFALETATGTAAALTAARGVTPVFNPSIKFSTEMVERQPQGSLSPIPQGLGASSAEVTFETELFNASAAPIWTDLLLACGLQATAGVYAPVDDPTATITFGHYINGRLRSAAGCMGSFKVMFQRGKAARIQWSFKGISQPLGQAVIAPTFLTYVAPVCGTGAFTAGGNTVRADELTFDAGNEVVLRQDINSPGGYRSAYITARKPMVTISPEALLAKDYNADFRATATAALSAAVGSGTNNVWTLAAPALQLTKDPEDGDRDGLLTDVLEFLCTRGTAAGGDEYSLTAA